MKEKYTSPSYQWYPERFESSPNVEDMTYEEEGVYRRLIDQQWKRGYVPDDPKRIAKLLPKVPRGRAMKIWAAIRHCFVEESPGRLVTPRLEEVRAYSAMKSAAGVASGESRRNRTRTEAEQNGEQKSNRSANETRTKREPPNSELRTREKKKEKGARPLPADFSVSEAMYEWALSREGLGVAAVDRLTELFVDWAHSRGKRYQDWPATWRNWVRNRGYQNSSNGTPVNPNRDPGIVV